MKYLNACLNILCSIGKVKSAELLKLPCSKSQGSQSQNDTSVIIGMIFIYHPFTLIPSLKPRYPRKIGGWKTTSTTTFLLGPAHFQGQAYMIRKSPPYLTTSTRLTHFFWVESTLKSGKGLFVKAGFHGENHPKTPDFARGGGKPSKIDASSCQG